MVDYGKGLGGNPYPLFKNFYAGGMGTVRGYESSSLGRVEYDYYGNRVYLGGTKRVVGNVELQFPMPGMAATRLCAGLPSSMQVTFMRTIKTLIWVI